MLDELFHLAILAKVNRPDGPDRRWCMNRSQPVKIPTHGPSSPDGVRRRPATLSHLVEDVACEDGLSPLPC
jgi:hypothetical protein